MAALLPVTAVVVPLVAHARGGTDCADLLVPHQVVAGYSVGEDSCVVAGGAATTDAAGHPWLVQTMDFSGSAAGWADPVTTGNTRKDLTDAPEYLLPQFGIATWTAGRGTYSADAGTGISVVYPQDRRVWNGDAVLLMHGQSNNSPLGTLVPQTPGGPLPATTFDNMFADEWIDAGYAVIYVARPASSGVPTTLAGGAQVDESLNDNVHAVLQWLSSGQRFLAQVLGAPPRRTFEDGHSAGTIWANVANMSGFNTRPDGSHVISGFLGDDPGGGLPLPLRMREGELFGTAPGPGVGYPADALLSAATRRQMVPVLTLPHEDYQDRHTWAPNTTYESFKEEAAELDKMEVPNITRSFMIAGVSHIPSSTGSPALTLDYGTVVQAAIPMLAAWVKHGVQPPASIIPPTGSDDIGRMVQLPPQACPTGLHYPWAFPNGAASATGYVGYDGTALEPVDARGVWLDVNHDGRRDAIPTMAQVWHQRHLATHGVHVTDADMVTCTRAATATLVRQRLLTPAGAAQWIARAATALATGW